MFVFLSKILPQLVYPLGLGCLLIILALILSKHRRLRTAALWAALAILWLGGNRWISSSLARSLEDCICSALFEVGAIVVLGGGTESRGSRAVGWDQRCR